MKKSLVALAVMAAAGAASAQSSVTLFGGLDLAVGSYRNGDASVTKMNSNGIYSSRFGVSGTEDLGGGLKGMFHLEAAISPDSGAAAGTNTNNQATGGTTGNGLTFNRRSTLSVGGGFGEIRLGRDYTPGFRNLTVFDAFGTNGVASASNLSLTGTAPATGVRASNGIAYLFNDGGFSSNAPGFYAQAQYRFGENASTAGATKNDGTGYGLRAGYAQGPLNVAAAYDQSSVDAGAAGSKFKQTNIGASYDLGAAKLMTQYTVNKTNTGVNFKIFEISAQIKVGAGHIPVSFTDLRASNGSSAKASQFGLGYVHNLSKRTSVYTSFASLGNKNGSAFGVTGGLGGVADKRSSGFEFGVKHSF